MRINSERNLNVIILSDHGATRIPKETFNIQEIFYSKRALNKHHRYLEISDDEISKLPENSKYQSYFLWKRNGGEIQTRENQAKNHGLAPSTKPNSYWLLIKSWRWESPLDFMPFCPTFFENIHPNL